jgi:hypothetical protein
MLMQSCRYPVAGSVKNRGIAINHPIRSQQAATWAPVAAAAHAFPNTSNPTYKVVSTCSRDTVKELTSRKPGK